MKKNKVNFAPWHIKDPIEVEKILLLGSSYYNGWKVNKDGTVNCNSSQYRPLCIINEDGKLQIKYRRAKNFSINSPKLISLWGCPDICSSSFELFSANNLKSLEHLPTHIGNGIVIRCRSLETMNTIPVECGNILFSDLGNFNILKRWKEVELYPKNGTIVFGYDELNRLYKNEGLLGLCLLSQKISNKIGLNLKYIADYPSSKEFPNINTLFSIISKNSYDILECQEQLITEGFHNYAKL